jgi:pimeloyl-ACP methyl ester carboxylesterase
MNTKGINSVLLSAFHPKHLELVEECRLLESIFPDPGFHFLLYKKLPKEIYIFSGLGADERVFQKIDLSPHHINFIKWIRPEKNESIEDYTKRLVSPINSSQPVLIGVSFGGLIAIEAAKQINTDKVIIISSIKTKKEIPFYYLIAGKLRLHKIFPVQLLKRFNFIVNWFFGVDTFFDKQLLKQILNDTDPVFLNWAIEKILCYNNDLPLQNIKHIHGTKDRILPYRFVKSDHTIKRGGHLMVLNKAEDVSRILTEELK